MGRTRSKLPRSVSRALYHHSEETGWGICSRVQRWSAEPNHGLHDIFRWEYKSGWRGRGRLGSVPQETSAFPPVFSTIQSTGNSIATQRDSLVFPIFSHPVTFSALYEERALILGRLKGHEQALTIFVSILNDFQAAENYCQLYYDRKDHINSQVLYFNSFIRQLFCFRSIFNGWEHTFNHTIHTKRVLRRHRYPHPHLMLAVLFEYSAGMPIK